MDTGIKRQFKQIGTRPARPDGVDKVKGRALYGADMSAPGQLTARILRSPHAHAEIVSIDTSAAEALPGVKAVVTGRDQNTGGADAALQGGVVDEGLLQGVQLVAGGHAFDGGDGGTLGLGGQNEAGADHAAIERDGAGAAIAGAAALFGAGHSEAVAQDVQQGFIGGADEFHGIAVEGGGNLDRFHF